MNTLLTAGRWFFGLALLCLGIQQLYEGIFLPVVLPPWPQWLYTPLFAYITAVVLIAAGVCLLTEKLAAPAAMFIACFFMLLFVCFQAPYLLFKGPYSPRHLGLWTDPLKELALAGGAFVMAGTFYNASGLTLYGAGKNIRPADRVRWGSILFGIMLTAFGIDHFLYIDTVSGMVPAWMPAHIFWAYFAGVALMAGGIALLFNIVAKTAALLLALMVFIWFLVLHVPAVINHPYVGGAVSGAFEAFAFTGIATVLFGGYGRKNPFIEEEHPAIL